MPLLKRKRLEPIPLPPYNPTKKESRNTTVWYSSITQEIFTDYSQYLDRITLVKKPIWQCETTGKSNMTYQEALESEKLLTENEQEMLPEQLQKSVLLYIQFQTARLDTIVDNAYQHFVNRYVQGEILNYVGEDNKTYHVKVIDVLNNQYQVQFFYKNSDKKVGLKIVPQHQLKRDRFVFSKNVLKKFIKESTIKDTYIGAPWIVSNEIAKRFGIDVTLPDDLQIAKDIAYSKSRKKRKETAAEVAAAQADFTNDNRIMIDARKIESTLKYPMNDLDVPIYRRDPSGSGYIIDMTPGTKGANGIAQNPTGGMPLRPQPVYSSSIPKACFGSFLMIWSFLNVFSQPLKLSPFSIDDFESALQHYEQCDIIAESHIALLNVIIKQRDRLKKESLGHGPIAMAAAISLYGSGYQASRVSLPHQQNLQQDSDNDGDDDEHVWKARPPVKRRVSVIDRGCGSSEVEGVGYNWDSEIIDKQDGWQDILIGFINQLAPIECIQDIDRILSQLVPSKLSRAKDRIEAYVTLGIHDKIRILKLLVHVANESFIIKSFMDECQDHLTELRKQKIDLSRERKRIHAERREMDENNAKTSDSEDSINDENRSNVQESRQEKIKRRQLETIEAKRLKIQLQQEQKKRKQLDEDERILHQKEEQVERSMRKYSNHRIRPLGRDKFYNQYYYLDDIGGALLHGSSRLYVKTPSDTDIMSLIERDSVESIDKSLMLPCGRGGGVEFVTQLLIAQGLTKESEFFKKRVDCIKNNDMAQPDEWWQSYEDPEELQKLIDWLNPKGLCEFKLKRELIKEQQNITNGMKKRINNQNTVMTHESASRRHTRNRVVSNFPPDSWLAYTNKLGNA